MFCLYCYLFHHFRKILLVEMPDSSLVFLNGMKNCGFSLMTLYVNLMNNTESKSMLIKCFAKELHTETQRNESLLFHLINFLSVSKKTEGSWWYITLTIILFFLDFFFCIKSKNWLLCYHYIHILHSKFTSVKQARVWSAKVKSICSHATIFFFTTAHLK